MEIGWMDIRTNQQCDLLAFHSTAFGHLRSLTDIDRHLSDFRHIAAWPNYHVSGYGE